MVFRLNSENKYISIGNCQIITLIVLRPKDAELGIYGRYGNIAYFLNY